MDSAAVCHCSFVDLRHMVGQEALLTDRAVAISEASRLALIDHLFTFLTHTRSSEYVDCPTCGEKLARTAPTEPAEDEEEDPARPDNVRCGARGN